MAVAGAGANRIRNPRANVDVYACSAETSHPAPATLGRQSMGLARGNRRVAEGRTIPSRRCGGDGDRRRCRCASHSASRSGRDQRVPRDRGGSRQRREPVPPMARARVYDAGLRPRGKFAGSADRPEFGTVRSERGSPNCLGGAAIVGSGGGSGAGYRRVRSRGTAGANRAQPAVHWRRFGAPTYCGHHIDANSGNIWTNGTCTVGPVAGPTVPDRIGRCRGAAVPAVRSACL